MQGNLQAALQTIQEQAGELKADIATGHNSLVDVIAGRDQIIHSALATLRQDRQEIRQEIAALGTRTQARGCDVEREELVAMALDIWREQLACCLKIEKAEAAKAARRQLDRGESFLAWLESGYVDWSRTLLERTHRASALWERASGEIEGDWVTRWCQRSKDDQCAQAK